MKRIITALSLLLILSGCAKDTEEAVLVKIQRSLVELETYTCVAQITQISNKGEKICEVTQQAKRNGEYRITVTAPEKIAGTVTIFNGKTVFQHNPRVEGSLQVDVPYSQSRNEILLTSFIKNYLNSEDVTVSAMTEDGAQMTVLEAVIPGDSPYLKTEKLWLDNETLLPVKLVIFDENENDKIVVTYKKIEYNVTLGDEVFTISDN